MKKLFLSLIAVVTVLSTFAGGIVTNTNQSAAFVRMPAQDAATGIHAAYHNPAGLTKLADGFHFQLNNQSIVQTKTITSTFPTLNNDTYVGDVKAPMFPSVYAAYKTGKLAISVGINPIGGGGGAEYLTGLPSFEQKVAAIPLLLSNTTEYSADVFFEGTSVFWGLQAGISYEINEMISVYGGIRYIMAKNTYNGHIKDMMINPVADLTAYGKPDYTGTMVSASDYFADYSVVPAAAASSMQPLIDGGAGGYTFAQADGVAITSTQRAQLEGGLLGAGIPQTQIDAMTLAQAQGAYSQISVSLLEKSEQTKDMEVDAEQTGSAIAPILGLHLTLMDEKLNIGMKYEFKTPLEVKNATVIDGSGLFADGVTVPSEMPALLSVGVDYKIMDNLSLAIGYHQYFDKAAKYGKKDVAGEYITNETFMDASNMELAVGLEYGIGGAITISGGWLMTKTGVKETYQSDMSYSLNTNTVAFGGQYKISDALAIDLGIMYTIYKDGEKNFAADATTGIPAYMEKYMKDTFTVGLGISYSFGGSGE